MGTGATSGASAGGIKPVPMQQLGMADWQGMKITADAMTPVPFMIYNGTTMQEVKPAKNTSFHLMVTLSDAQTGVAIPYATVWATITKGSARPFDESLWPMISRYMGPHYGNDVALPGAGTYQLTLLVSPPVSARHVEYEDVWLKPHKVTFTFHWKPTASSVGAEATAGSRRSAGAGSCSAPGPRREWVPGGGPGPESTGRWTRAAR